MVVNLFCWFAVYCFYSIFISKTMLCVPDNVFFTACIVNYKDKDKEWAMGSVLTRKIPTVVVRSMLGKHNQS